VAVQAHQRAKSDVLDLMRRVGLADRVAEAEATLPDVVDLRRHADLLAHLGLGPDALADRLGGSL
jgi:hypothetical protein